jgi:hypothetical protein
LTNGNYVVRSTNWDSGSVQNVGAVTWGNGTSGISGVVSASNSLVGSRTNDNVGNGGVTALTNGNYVVRSTSWDSGAIDVGAVTWGNGTSGISGLVSSSNSLVGSTINDNVGGSVTALSNGNYVVASADWDRSATSTNVGAVTWGNGTSGISGVVSSSNSLVGSTASDNVGFTGVTELTNGNYVVRSTNWDSGSVQNVGAVTWGNGTSGISGMVSSSNSLVGSTAHDNVGNTGVTELTNGNYVVASATWDRSSSLANVGAVTWGNGTSGISGVVSSSNSLVGFTASDTVGNSGLTALTNGNYVVLSSSWDSGTINDVGAVTWGNGTSGISGVVSSSNSLVGSTASDAVGAAAVTALTNGNYVIRSSSWDSGSVQNVGAVTWGNGTSGISGVVSSSNSIVGQTANQGGTWSITTASNLDAFLARNQSDGSGRVVLGSSARGFSLPSTPAGSLQAGNGSVALSVAETTLQGTISSNADVTITPSQTARQIDLGSKTSGKLGLTDTELDRISAATLRIGNASSGDLTISSPISRTTSTAMQLTSGGAILLGAGAQSSNGAIHTAGGTLSLDAGTNFNPATPGVDADTSALSFAAGDTLRIDITGATVDTQYGQLSVAGPVTLTGVNLSLGVNFPGMTGTETFTIVTATGGVTGQFSGLIQGGTISVGSFSYAANYTSNSVQLVPATVTAPSITQDPSNQTVVNGNTATFTASASGSPTPTVKWQISTNGGTSWSDIAGATSTTYSFTAASGDNGNQYRAVFTNTVASVTSNAATLTVNYAPSVTQNPSNSTVNAGSTASFTAAATGNPTPTVQWQLSTNGGTNWSDIAGATSTTYSFTAASGDNGNQYRAVFTNSVASTNSTGATLNVSSQSAPSITAHPSNTGVEAGQTASFSAAANGNPTPSVQWQLSTNGGTNWSDIAGATSTTYSFTAASGDNGNQYRAVFTNGVGSAATTSDATLTVQYAPTITSGNAATFAAGVSESFQVVATGNPAASYSITSGSLPSGVTLNPSTGALSGKAAIGTVGTYPVTISASNGIGTPATQAFTLTVVSQLTSIQVSKGQAQRTYLRYIDLTMANASVATQLASNASTRMKLVKRDLNGNNPSEMSLTGLVSASGSTVAIDFGAAGIGGARNTNLADGYYALQFDLDSDGTFETTYNFFRLFGDTNGDGKVDQTDVNNVTAGMTAYSAEYDLNFDGRVTSGDLILVRRALGRALNPSLPLG